MSIVAVWTGSRAAYEPQLFVLFQPTSFTENIAVRPQVVVEKVQTTKDLGVVFDSKLDGHIDEKVNKVYKMLGVIKRSFIHITPDSFLILYKALVRSHLEYAVLCMESPLSVFDWKTGESPEKSNKVSLYRCLKYEERLRKLNLPTLKFRRLRGDMIEV